MPTSPASAGPPQLLDAALRRDPARPLITFYDDATDERTELSVTTFANWVAKTANLLRDDLGLEPGATAALDLPAHWQAAVWLQACWALGLHVVPAGSVADLTVIAYGGAAPGGSGEVVALGLGPMGLPRRDAGPPTGTTLDYDREVHGHGDRFVAAGAPDPAAPALTVADDVLGGGRPGGRRARCGAAACRCPAARRRADGLPARGARGPARPAGHRRHSSRLPPPGPQPAAGPSAAGGAGGGRGHGHAGHSGLVRGRVAVNGR